MSQPAVSIVIPCHNGGRFIDALMASLAAQTFRDFEVIIVNDGSTEPLTLRKLDELRPQLQVIDQENRYLPGARNTGFQAARADLVLPLDCDDTLAPEFLEVTVAALKDAPDDVGFAFTHMRLVGGLAGVLHNRFDPFDQLFLNQLPYCMLIRKSAWTAAHGYDETMRDGLEDWEFNIRLAEAGYRGLEIARPLFIYNVRPDGMLLSKSARMQGTIWREIRDRHRDLYRVPALVALWRSPGRRMVSTFNAVALLGAASILPESWFDALFFRMMMLVRSWRVRRGIIHSGTAGR
jgi:glycosyltransferase involved in cell wall biosynthesis